MAKKLKNITFAEVVNLSKSERFIEPLPDYGSMAFSLTITTVEPSLLDQLINTTAEALTQERLNRSIALLQTYNSQFTIDDYRIILDEIKTTLGLPEHIFIEYNDNVYLDISGVRLRDSSTIIIGEGTIRKVRFKEEIYCTLLHEIGHLMLGHVYQYYIYEINDIKGIYQNELDADTYALDNMVKMGVNLRLAAYDYIRHQAEMDVFGYVYKEGEEDHPRSSERAQRILDRADELDAAKLMLGVDNTL